MSWHPCLPGLGGTRTVGSLGSSGITRLPRYSGPVRHRLVVHALPGGDPVIGRTQLPPLSRRDEDGFSSCSTCPHPRAVPPTPPKCPAASVRLPPVLLPSPRTKGLGLRDSFFSRPLVGSLALRPGDSLTIPGMAWSVGFLRFVSSAEATQATGVLTIPPVGLTPTEHASLRWTRWSAKLRADSPYATYHLDLITTLQRLMRIPPEEAKHCTIMGPSPPLEPPWATLPSALPSRHRPPRISRIREGESSSRHPVNPNPFHAPTGSRCPLRPATLSTSDEAHRFQGVTHADLRRASEGAALRPPWHPTCEEVGAGKKGKVRDWRRGPDESRSRARQRFHAEDPTGSERLIIERGQPREGGKRICTLQCRRSAAWRFYWSGLR